MQRLTEIQATAQPTIRKNLSNQLSSEGKTQNSSSIKQTNINNLLSDLKTPDKALDYHSVSGNKNFTQDKFSHEKFQINSNSVEKFMIK